MLFFLDQAGEILAWPHGPCFWVDGSALDPQNRYHLLQVRAEKMSHKHKNHIVNLKTSHIIRYRAYRENLAQYIIADHVRENLQCTASWFKIAHACKVSLQNETTERPQSALASTIAH